MLKKVIFSLAGLLATGGLAWAVTLSDGTVTQPVTIYSSTGAVAGNAGVGTETSSSQSNVGTLKAQAMIYNGSAGNLVPMSSAGSSSDANAGANMVSVGNSVFNGATWDRQRSSTSDGAGSTGFATQQKVRFNGTSYDRERNNLDLSGLITLATTSANGTDQTNFNGRGLKCTYDITAITGTNTTLTIQGKDVASGKYFTLLASAALTTTGTTVLTVYPGLTASANAVANDVVPRTWRVITTNTALSAFTGTLGCSSLL